MALTNTFLIEADIKRKNHIGKPVVTANDSITFIISVMDNGVPMDLANVTSANLVSLCPDRQVIETAGVIGTGGKVTFSLSTEETAVAGTVRATVQLHGADGRVSTISFTYEVAKDLLTLHTPTIRERTLIEVVLEDGPLRIQEAEEATLDANLAAAKAEQVATENKTRFLAPVDTVALRNSTYPNPVHGDTVRVTSEASAYRFQTGSGWVKTDQYNPTAIDNVTAQLAEKASKVEVDDKLAAIGDAKPSGVYATLTALQTTFPTGNGKNIYLVSADGKWYFWNGTAWTAGGIYQSTEIADRSITANKTNFLSSSESINRFNKLIAQDGGYYSYTTGAWTASASVTSTAIIPIKQGDIVRFKALTTSAYNITYWNASGGFISGIKPSLTAGQLYDLTVNVSNVAGIRVGIVTADKDQFMFTVNNAYPSAYEAYSDSVSMRIDDALKVPIVELIQQETQSLVTSKLQGLKWGVVGDSNQVIGYKDDGQGYVKRISDKYGMTLQNLAVSGSGIAQFGVRTDYMCERVLLLDTNCDVVIVAGGVNDYYNAVPLGVIGDTDKTTFYGALDLLCKNLITRFPTTPKAIFTPLKFRAKNNTLVAYVDAIKTVAAKYAIPVLDNFTKSDLQPDIDMINNTYFYQADGLHPNGLGHAVLARGVDNFMFNLV